MELWQRLGLLPGVICAVGSGGKTTLLHRLARELPGTVIFCTTTKIFPSARLPVLCGADEAQLTALLRRSRAVCIGTPTEEGKLSTPRLPFDALRRIADYVLVEADGSRGLPLKAHRPNEPVLPEHADRVLNLVGALGLGRPVCEAAHCPERYTELSGLGLSDPVTPEAAAAVLRYEGLGDTVIVNQAELPEPMQLARALAAHLSCPVFAGSVRDGALIPLK